MTYLVGIQMGAGPRLSSSTFKKMRSCLEEALGLASRKSAEGCLAHNIAIEVTKFLEDCPITNAGTGSNLRVNGEVECDATFISRTGGKMRVASVGAISNIKNPVEVCAQLLLDAEKNTTLQSTPVFLCGKGAEMYAWDRGIACANLEVAAARAKYDCWNKFLEDVNEHQIAERYVDTVAVFVTDGIDAYVCASSGGPILGEVGRVGPAAIPGASVHCSAAPSVTIALCSGFGEDIITSGLARLACSADDLRATIERLPSSVQLQRSPYCGILRVVCEKDCFIIDWAHTTESMVCGVLSSSSDVHFICSNEPSAGGFRLEKT